MKRLARKLDRLVTAKLTRVPLDRFLARHARAERTLDVGSSSGFYSKYFPNRVALDHRAAPGVQVVCDAHHLCFGDEVFDVVLCTEVLEHLVDPGRALGEMHRVLRQGGTLLLTTRFLFPIHDSPGDYYRFTRYGLEHLLKRFSTVEIEEETDPIGTLAVLVQRLGIQTQTLWWRPLRLGWHLLARAIRKLSFLTTAEYGDSRGTPATHSIMTSGYYVKATKTGRESGREDEAVGIRASPGAQSPRLGG
jgi:SAM-dependent methyltransferase